MLRGRAVLRDLARELEKSHGRYADALEALREVEARHEALIDAEGRIFEKLSRIYLPELSPTAVASGFAELRGRLEGSLRAQEERRERLSEEAVRAGERVEMARARVAGLEEDGRELRTRLDEARAKVEAVLDGDAAHTERAEEHAALMALRQRLRKRRERLSAAASAERPRYERDRLFRYLHDRDWGGPAYDAGPLTRRLDRWLARRIGYETLARNYRILKLGPHQLGAEIHRLGRRAQELEAAVDSLEEEVARAEGLLPLLERRAELEARATEARAELDRSVAARDAVQRELRAVEARRGRNFEEAVEMHRDYLKGKTLRELEAVARSTPDPRDDGLVQELEALRAKLDRLTGELADRREEMRRASERVDGLSTLHAAGLKHLAHPGRVLPDGFDLGALVGAVTSGRAGVEDAVAELKGARPEEPLVEEVPRPYFESVYRELTAAFDVGLEGASVVHEQWEVDGHVETEVVVRDARGRVIRRRVTGRDLGDPGGGPAAR
ncbi:MAG: hypothetical protein PVI57_03095 [Gemmatimonadota bacterium]